MFTEMKAELKELIRLVRETENYDATLVADRSIVPTEAAQTERHRKEARKIELLLKYELA